MGWRAGVAQASPFSQSSTRHSDPERIIGPLTAHWLLLLHLLPRFLIVVTNVTEAGVSPFALA